VAGNVLNLSFNHCLSSFVAAKSLAKKKPTTVAGRGFLSKLPYARQATAASSTTTTRTAICSAVRIISDKLTGPALVGQAWKVEPYATRSGASQISAMGTQAVSHGVEEEISPQNFAH